jgi:hypothetical protein
VLQQASGNVRCGNCGHAFNALDYLSEEMPAPSAVEDASTEDLSHDELAETSRQLLETLDELAGPDDVRIEDTGIEWRVLDEATAGPTAAAAAATEEPRYDDNTPLPDDYGEEPDFQPAPMPEPAPDPSPVRVEDANDRQTDLALSEPDDWTDILEEVRDPDAGAPPVKEELAAIQSELSAIDDALTDEVPILEDDEPAAVDVAPGTDEEVNAPVPAAPDDEDRAHGQVAVDFELGDDEDTGVFEAADDDASATGDHEFAGVFDFGDDETGVVDHDVGEALPDATTGNDEIEPGTVADLIGEEASLIESLELASGDETDGADESQAGDVPDGADTTLEPAPAGEDPDEEPAYADDGAAEVDADEAVLADDAVEREAAPDGTGDEDTDIEAEDDAADEEDFTATLMGLENPEALFDESSGEVETIVMEGEFVRTEIERERIAAENAARSQLDDPARLADTYATSRGKLRGGRRSDDPPSTRMIAVIAGLAVLLVGQLIHNARQSLATIGFFDQAISPVYELLGNPVIPAWDVRGWQFEATNGRIDAGETTLTITSRIANRSDEPLPYPLVHLSLTNRYEDVMGSRVLEPADYLPADSDPGATVAPGDNFTALLEVRNPSPDATGFKLNVCYRVDAGTVRCAIEDFKN